MASEAEQLREKLVVSKPPFFYLKTALIMDDDLDDVDVITFKALIVKALQTLHGQVGGALLVDVLKFSSENGQALLRIRRSDLAKVWSALTLLGSYDGKTCLLQVLQMSTSLTSLAINSRDFFP